MNQPELNSFDGSASYFWPTNADGTVSMSFFDSGGRQIPWPGFNISHPPSQIRQPVLSTAEPHGNQEFMNPNHFNSMPIRRPSMSSSQNANPSASGFLRPSQQRHNIFPPHTPRNIPDPPWNREASSPQVSTSTSSASPRNSATPSDASPAGIGNHDANANPDTNTNTSANSSPTGLSGRTRFTLFICHLCSFSSKTQRDFDRHMTSRAHLRKHGHHDTERTVRRFHCAVRDCRYASDKGFTRMDNLKRHERDKHKLRDTFDTVPVREGQGEAEEAEEEEEEEEE